MAKNKIKRIFSSLLVILSVGVFIYYFYKNTAKFEPLLHINPIFLIFIAVANLGGILINGLFLKVIIKPFNKYIGVLESFYISLISTVGNFFAPAGTGFGIRALYLKKKHNLSYSDFITTLSGNYVIVFLVTSLSGLIALVGLRHNTDERGFWAMVAIFVGLFIIDIFLISTRVSGLSVRLFNRINADFFVTKIIKKIIDGWHLIISDKALLKKLVGLTSIGLPLSITITWLILASLHLSISFWGMLLLVSISSLSVFINLTPGNIGIKELVLVFSANVVGLSTAEMLSYAVIDRGVIFFVLFTSWLFMSLKNKK